MNGEITARPETPGEFRSMVEQVKEDETIEGIITCNEKGEPCLIPRHVLLGITDSGLTTYTAREVFNRVCDLAIPEPEKAPK